MPAHDRPAVPPAFLAVTAVLGGAMVMVIEILGARVIGPFFGVSLFVWTALIAVTLVSLAIGYAVGGWLSDRALPARTLYGCVLAAGGLMIMVPWAKIAILKACAPLGLRLGSLVAATSLFGPSMILLGCMSPLIVKLAVDRNERLGRTVGTLYALSTVGSLAGTVATGYFLIAYFGIDRIFLFGGGALVVCAVSYFLLIAKRPAALALLVLPLAGIPSAGPVTRKLADGTEATLAYRQDSLYGSIRVIDYRHGRRHTRELVIDGMVQGGIDVADGQSVYEYSYLLSRLPPAFRPGGRRCVVIGLGLGAVPRWFSSHGVATDVVEISPQIVQVARTQFGFPDSIRVFEADARQFFLAGDDRYDYVIVDAYTGDSTPLHLLSLEAMQSIRARMTDEGVVAFNLHGNLTGENRMTLSIIKTIAAVFPDVRLYRLASPLQDGSVGSLIIIAGSALPPNPAAALLSAQTIHPFAAELVRRSIAAPLQLPSLENAVILTDDYNPVDLLDLPNKESVRRGILESTHWDMLLG